MHSKQLKWMSRNLNFGNIRFKKPFNLIYIFTKLEVPNQNHLPHLPWSGPLILNDITVSKQALHECCIFKSSINVYNITTENVPFTSESSQHKYRITSMFSVVMLFALIGDLKMQHK